VNTGNATNGYVIVTTTVDNAEAARKLAAEIVDAQLAACVQRMPIQSTYRWQGKVETAAEFLLQAKTRAGLAEALIAFIQSRHTYETPELVVTPILDGEATYLAWIDAETVSAAGEARDEVEA